MSWKREVSSDRRGLERERERAEMGIAVLCDTAINLCNYICRVYVWVIGIKENVQKYDAN